MEDKIDVVILWVDGSEKEWRVKRNYWAKEYGLSDLTEERYRDWDNLKYVFRGIEKHAPWINNIYIVTDSQKPKWLNLKNNRVKLIDHKKIIESEYLPTFNSRVIELNIHKIEGLSENFIYLNDDTFIIDDVKQEDFFKNGFPVDLGIMLPFIPEYNQPIYKTIFNNMTIINDHFKKRKVMKSRPFNWFNIKYGYRVFFNLLMYLWPRFSAFYDPHISTAFKKQTFIDVWNEYEEDLNQTLKTKFRSEQNYNQWLMRYWQLASNNFVPQKINFGKVFSIDGIDASEECVRYIQDQKSKIVCINDNENLIEFKESKQIINECLQKKFPDKSEFEI